MHLLLPSNICILARALDALTGGVIRAWQVLVEAGVLAGRGASGLQKS